MLPQLFPLSIYRVSICTKLPLPSVRLLRTTVRPTLAHYFLLQLVFIMWSSIRLQSHLSVRPEGEGRLKIRSRLLGVKRNESTVSLRPPIFCGKTGRKRGLAFCYFSPNPFQSSCNPQSPRMKRCANLRCQHSNAFPKC